MWLQKPPFFIWTRRGATSIRYGPILALAIFSAIRSLTRGWPYFLCVLPAIYFTLLHTIFVSSLRYREPAMFGLIVLAAAVLSETSKRGTRKSELGT